MAVHSPAWISFSERGGARNSQRTFYLLLQLGTHPTETAGVGKGGATVTQFCKFNATGCSKPASLVMQSIVLQHALMLRVVTLKLLLQNFHSIPSYHVNYTA